MNKKYSSRISQAKINNICQIINSELFQKEAFLEQGFTAQRLAERNGLDVRNISAVMVDCFGCNFSTLVQRLRVNRMCRMLSSKDSERVTCENIGLRCGFANRQSLYNAFRKFRDVTPEQYRQQNLNNNE